MMESFFKVRKYDEVLARLPNSIEGAYNQERFLSALVYRELKDFERLLLMQENYELPAKLS